MPDIPEDTRVITKDLVLSIEGSGRDTGMTCISMEDHLRVSEAVRKGITNRRFEDLGNFGNALHNRRFKGNLRSMNKHCDECLTEGCKDRVDLSREQIRKMTEPGAPVSSRGSKVGLHLQNEVGSGSPLADLTLTHERV